MRLFKKKRIYLDYASATPVRKEVRRTMEKYFSHHFHNSSSIYDEGTFIKNVLSESRAKIARTLHAGAKDIIFTSGGTESDNLAILGVFEKAIETKEHPHIIVTEHEHPAILEAAREAERKGARLSIVSVEDIISHITKDTVLVSVSLCQSETGELVHATKIGRAVREARKKYASEYPYLHIDASQAVVTQAINVDTLHADLLTLDAGKIYGPKGVGLLVVRPWVRLKPILFGGGQEKGLRSGTENIPGIVGFAEALTLLTHERESEVARMQEVKSRGIELLRAILPEAVINSARETVPNILSVTLPCKLHEFVAVGLADKGVLVSTGSSCSARKDEKDKEALRFSFGRETMEKDIITAIRTLKEILL